MTVIKKLRQPVLGVCLGMQILYEFSEEGEVERIGVFHKKMDKITYSPSYMIPHMGWDNLE
ncbi:glutamine amidotransferase-related protein [Pajaroellobacter abortibovis]|nr:hypothetical protein [Pajaroellobacter abortibovis]